MLDERDLQAISALIAPINTAIAELKSDVTELKTDVTELKSDVTELKTDVTELKSDVAELKSGAAELNTRVSALEDGVLGVKCILEDETNKSIRLIAEAHQDNNRHTHEAETIAKETKFAQEMLGIRLNIVEGTVSRLKKAVGID